MSGPLPPHGHRRAPVRLLLAAALALALAAIPAGTTPAPHALTAVDGIGIHLVDVTDRLGVDFVHSRLDSPEKHIPETVGSGVGWIDYDLDGRQDLYFTDAGAVPEDPWAPPRGDSRAPNVLYRGAPGPRLRPAPTAGLDDPGYGQGISFADFDNDGWPDVFVANFGTNRLLRNNGDGTYDAVALPSVEQEPAWTSSVAWGDFDLDGFPDLLALSYLEYDPAHPVVCGRLDQGIRSYCPPTYFPGARDLLFHNLGDGRFAEIGRRAGVANAEEGKGLGVVIGDIDVDGMPDAYVANDTTRNFLYRNLGDLAFTDDGVISGAGYGDNGRAQSGMGTDLGDIDGDGWPDLVVTNFSGEPYNVYRSIGPGMFVDETYGVGVGMATLPVLGFGIALVDLDGDVDLDIAIANGHLHQHLDGEYAQPNQVFVNQRRERADPQGALLTDVSADAGEAVIRKRVSRALAVGDVDGDGWPDLAVTNVADRGEVLLNASDVAHHRIVLRVRGRTSNRDGLHARIEVIPDGAEAEIVTQTFERESADSYLAQPAADLYVGLGDAAAATVTITWPGGAQERIEGLESGHLALIREGSGLVARRPLRERMVYEMRRNERE